MDIRQAQDGRIDSARRSPRQHVGRYVDAQEVTKALVTALDLRGQRTGDSSAVQQEVQLASHAAHPDGQADPARHDHGQPDFLPEIVGRASRARTSIRGHVNSPTPQEDPETPLILPESKAIPNGRYQP